MKTKFFGFTGAGRRSSQIEWDGRDGVQNKRDETGTGYISKNHLRGEPRRVGESYGVGSVGHQNSMLRTSLVSTASGSGFSTELLLLSNTHVRMTAARVFLTIARIFCSINIINSIV